jgi:hypothetical protein
MENDKKERKATKGTRGGLLAVLVRAHAFTFALALAHMAEGEQEWGEGNSSSEGGRRAYLIVWHEVRIRTGSTVSPVILDGVIQQAPDERFRGGTAYGSNSEWIVSGDTDSSLLAAQVAVWIATSKEL